MSLSKSTIKKFINGDNKAIEQVYLEYKNLMYFVIASYIPSSADCDDILSDAFIKAINNAKTLRNTDNIKYFLTTIAKNEALSFIRKEKDVQLSDVIDEMYGEDDKTNSFLSMIEPLLTNKETIVIYLKIGFSYTWSEIAQETGISESTARRLYESAKAKLKEAL